MSPVVGSASTRDALGRGLVAEATHERVVEADPLGAAVEPHRRLGALEHDVLVAEREPEPLAQRLVAQAHREERLAAGQQVVDGRRNRPILGSSPSRGSPGPGPDDHQVGAVEGAGA